MPTKRVSQRTGVSAAPTCLLYLYGITGPDTVAAELLRMRRVPGIDPAEPLFPLEAAGLVAAVSNVPADVFDEEPLNALVTDLARLAPYAVRHEQAIRALAGSALVPMTFGSVYRSSERVASLLEERADQFRAMLVRVEGREEWGLRVVGEIPRLLEAADRDSEALRRLAAEAAAASPGRGYLIRKQAERLRDQEASRLVAAMLTAILERLRPLAAAVVQDDPGPSQPGTEQLLLKAAFLVERAAAGAFSAVAQDLGAAYAARGLRLDLSGPWAPYSFVRGEDATHA